MTMTPKKSVLRDTQFPHRRTILGIRVLVNPPFEGSCGMTVENFAVRIKHPTLGVLDFTCPAFFYWQAFNEARKYLLSAQ